MKGLSHKDRAIQSDCIKVLYEAGSFKPSSMFEPRVPARVLPPLPRRQAVQWPLGAAASRGPGRGSAALGFVFSIPKALRVFLRYDQRLFGLISRLIFSLIAGFYSAAAGEAIAQYEWSPRAKPALTIRAALRTIARAPLSLQTRGALMISSRTSRCRAR